MTQRPRLFPGPEHPIAIAPAEGRVIVRSGDTVLADSPSALTLREADYPPVLYIPRQDTIMSNLRASARTTYCPYKGEAGYFDIPALGESGANAIWTYEQPYDAVAAIAGHLAFYPDRVTIEITPE